MKKILVADDYEPFLKHMEYILTEYLDSLDSGKEEYRLLECSDGSKALEAYNKERPVHSAFLDIRMPGKRGTELAEIFHKDDPGMNICLISIIERREGELIRKALPYIDFVSKENLVKEIGEILEKYFGSREKAPEAYPV